MCFHASQTHTEWMRGEIMLETTDLSQDHVWDNHRQLTIVSRQVETDYSCELLCMTWISSINWWKWQTALEILKLMKDQVDLMELSEFTLTKEGWYHLFWENYVAWASKEMKVCGTHLTILGLINKGSLNLRGTYSSHQGAPMLIERRAKVALPIKILK